MLNIGNVFHRQSAPKYIGTSRKYKYSSMRLKWNREDQNSIRKTYQNYEDKSQVTKKKNDRQKLFL